MTKVPLSLKKITSESIQLQRLLEFIKKNKNLRYNEKTGCVESYNGKAWVLYNKNKD